MKKLIRMLLRGSAAVCCISGVALLAQSQAKPPAKPSLEQRVRAIEDRDAILKTLHQYAFLIDFGHDVAEYTDLYTEDAIFQPNAANGATPTSPGAVVGRTGLEKWITNEWQIRERLVAAGHYRIHETIGSDVALDGDRATARSYFQTTDNDKGRIYIVSIGVYQDQLVRSPDGRWRLQERLLLRQGSVAPGTAGAPLERPAGQ